MQLIEDIKHSFESDATWRRVHIYGGRALRATPQRSLEYLADKFPIIGWLPRYQPRWLISDIVAGLTLGIMLIPQSLAYAQIADIPVEYGLMASWLPATIYAFMGTSKDLSTGPTSLIGLLTAQVVHDLEGDYKPQAIAAAVAFWMGVYGMVLGFLRLGFLLEFICEPVLTGFISAAAITIGLGQVKSLLGEKNIRDGAANIIHDTFQQLPTCNGKAAAVGICGIIMLCILQHIGTRWGKTSSIAWFLSITRAFFVVVLFTGVSYAVNKDKTSKTMLFDISKVDADGILPAKVPDTTLLKRAATGAISAFVAAAVEHVAIARAFGARNDYVTDPSQELTYMGVTNFINSFLGAMGVGGAMSRTAVNSQCNVRSPLSGFVTTAVVLISLYFLSGALYWIPKATLAAIIIVAIWPLIGSWRTYYHFWRTSLVDFIASMLAFWISLFVTTAYGIASGVGWGIVYYLLRLAFTRTTVLGSESAIDEGSFGQSSGNEKLAIPSDTRVFVFHESVFFPNASRIKTLLIDAVKTFHSPALRVSDAATPAAAARQDKSRVWSVVGEKRVAKNRKRAGLSAADIESLPPIRVLVLDCTKITYVDATAMHVLGQVVDEVRKYAGDDVQIRFAAATELVLDRFRRSGWELVERPARKFEDGKGAGKRTVGVYRGVREAVADARRDSEIGLRGEKRLDANEKGGDVTPSSGRVERIEIREGGQV